MQMLNLKPYQVIKTCTPKSFKFCLIWKLKLKLQNSKFNIKKNKMYMKNSCNLLHTLNLKNPSQCSAEIQVHAACNSNFEIRKNRKQIISVVPYINE